MTSAPAPPSTGRSSRAGQWEWCSGRSRYPGGSRPPPCRSWRWPRWPFGAGLGLPTAWLVLAFAGAMWFAGGIGHGVKNVLARTLIQGRVPARLHGRAFAAYNGLRNGAELVALAAGGALVAALGARPTLALAGAIPVLAAVGGVITYGRGAAVRPRPSGRAQPAGSEASSLTLST